MKFGQKLQSESVPRWRIHNIDYNSLKYEIKVHTTKNQASAIVIPGSEDVALTRFENGFYEELQAQHERVGDFVSSKTDEIGHRLNYLTTCIHQLSMRFPKHGHDASPEKIAKRQRRFCKYEHEFLSARFRENILYDPKSFTRRDLTHLQSQYDVLLAELRETLPEDDIHPGSPESLSVDSQSISAVRSLPSPITPQQRFASPQQPVHYWNEYDNGSEAGDHEEEYAIYINPDQEMEIPGFEFIKKTFARPLAKARSMLTLQSLRSNPGERAPLLGIFGSARPNYSADTDDDYTSSEELPTDGYATHYAAFPSIADQQATRKHNEVFLWVAIASFLVSFALIAITSALITTGRHKMRLEVEAGVTVGIITSLFSACVGLGISLTRTDRLLLWHHVSLWLSFLSICVLNGMLLVLVVEW
ncbi:hypothetical protein Cpir12675_004915 [Ceratocystis pirilliformis]|uniref:SPX domain-containing protein n=1 Tax=Ceratocystis pirilliformis TaxID=259994 RepID=A0ABR3YTL0_9PEZI